MGKDRLKIILLVKIPLALVLFSALLVTLLRWVPPGRTPVMLKRAFQFRQVDGYRTDQEWVSLEDISPELIEAVILSEDQKFYSHHGFDFGAIRTMWKAHRRSGARLRGCSTISQQTAKNVFTFGTRAWVRKIPEAWWTILIELIWRKDRILEVYLNVAEWGRGCFGAEAASKEYYGVSASELDCAQATSLAVCLPRPLVDNPLNMSPEFRKRRAHILKEMSNNKNKTKHEKIHKNTD